MLGVAGRTLLVERGVAVIAIAIVAAATAMVTVEGSGTDKELVDIANMWQERDKKDQDDAKRTGEGIPAQDTHNFGSQGACRGKDDVGI